MGETGVIEYLLPIAITIVCVIHIIKTGRNFIWVYVVIFLPLFGGALCLFRQLGDHSRNCFEAARARKFGARSPSHPADPNKSFREARRIAELTGSVDSKRALAEEYAKRGDYGAAIEIYRDTLVGQFKDDPALLMGLARTLFQSGDGAGTQATLDQLQAADPSFVSGDGHLLYARALELQGKNDEALVEYERLVRYFAGEKPAAATRCCWKKMGRGQEAPTSLRRNPQNAGRRCQNAIRRSKRNGAILPGATSADSHAGADSYSSAASNQHASAFSNAWAAARRSLVIAAAFAGSRAKISGAAGAASLIGDLPLQSQHFTFCVFRLVLERL